jgi:UDPglucose 6-dehydrogenase
MILFLGTSHAAVHLKAAASARRVQVTDDPFRADVIFVSEDTPTDEQGNRDLARIEGLVRQAASYDVPVVLTSQVPPGFTRSLEIRPIYHQAETLRIKDAGERALFPEQFIVGCDVVPARGPLPMAYADYLAAFGCTVQFMTFEDAEYSKIAINMFLAAQVDTTNRLAEGAKRAGADWARVAEVLKLDRRIGPHAYLEPGRWQDSTHLYRDHVTLEALLAR